MKKFKSIFIIVLGIILSLSSVSFATLPDLKKDEQVTEIVSMSDETIEKNKEFYLILNLSNISFSKFKVEITNTSSLSADEITSSVSNLSTNSVVTSFIVDKSSINLDKLGIVYTSPKETCVINFEIKITNLDETIDSLKEEQKIIEIELNTLESNLGKLKEILAGLEEGTEEYKSLLGQIEEVESNILNKNTEKEELNNKIINFEEEKLSAKTEIEVVDEKSQDELNEKDESKAWNEKEDMLMMEEKNKEMTNSMKEMMTKMSSLETNLKDANDTISSLTKNVTYQGSQNNYLKSLSIDGIELENTFNKTNSNYFVTVSKDVSKVTVNAIPEDNSATVTIYGNTELKEGKNKILITVTADDGSTRTYKIYVTK